MFTTAIGVPIAEIDTPALCLDRAVLEANIARMAACFAGSGVRLRPHAKTHKSPVVAHMQIAAGAIGITCAKLGEAEVMAAAGIKDILIANQVVTPAKMARLANLAAYTEVMVAVEDAENVAELAAAAAAAGARLRVLLEVNIGMNRCGVEPGAPALELAQAVASHPSLRFEGVMGYEGHCVFIPDFGERELRAREAVSQLVETAELLRANGLPVNIVSSGGTGTHLITGRIPGVTELQVGSYATMDAQYRTGVGIDFDYALTLLATVTSVHGERAECDAGLKTVTQDFGLPIVLDPPGWTLTGLSEEHAHLRRVDGPALKRGDKVRIVPNHGCTTINLHDAYHVIGGGKLQAIWPIAARGKSR